MKNFINKKQYLAHRLDLIALVVALFEYFAPITPWGSSYALLAGLLLLRLSFCDGSFLRLSLWMLAFIVLESQGGRAFGLSLWPVLLICTCQVLSSHFVNTSIKKHHWLYLNGLFSLFLLINVFQLFFYFKDFHFFSLSFALISLSLLFWFNGMWFWSWPHFQRGRSIG